MLNIGNLECILWKPLSGKVNPLEKKSELCGRKKDWKPVAGRAALISMEYTAEKRMMEGTECPHAEKVRQRKAEEQDQCLLLSHKRQQKLSVQEPLKKQRRTFFKAFHCLVICTAFIYQYKSWSQRSQPKPSANVISFLENLSPAWIHYQLLLDKDCAVLAVPNQLCSQMS